MEAHDGMFGVLCSVVRQAFQAFESSAVAVAVVVAVGGGAPSEMLPSLFGFLAFGLLLPSPVNPEFTEPVNSLWPGSNWALRFFSACR